MSCGNGLPSAELWQQPAVRWAVGEGSSFAVSTEGAPLLLCQQRGSSFAGAPLQERSMRLLLCLRRASNGAALFVNWARSIAPRQ
jgi:hypothetical protein